MADNLNISPDMVQNLINMLKNSSNAQSSQSTQHTSNANTNHNNKHEYNININQNNQYPNNSNADQNNQYQNNSNADQNKQYQNNSNADQNSRSQSESSATNIDFETIMKMKSIMETLNSSNDQDSKLLYSLKPYLRKSRQAKLDQYINILKITQVSKLFNAKSENK